VEHRAYGDACESKDDDDDEQNLFRVHWSFLDARMRASRVLWATKVNEAESSSDEDTLAEAIGSARRCFPGPETGLEARSSVHPVTG
jgi:hypothetical protein